MDDIEESIFNESENEEEPAEPENPELRQLIDSAGLIIQSGILSKSEGRHILEQIKKRVETLFPDQIEIFNKEPVAHLNNLIEEFCVPDLNGIN